ncbi:MAG: DVU0298 family protein [Thermodesulforhabdaceae bacterium]
MSRLSSRAIRNELKALFERKKSEKSLLWNDSDKATIDLIFSCPTASLNPLVFFLSSPDPVEKWGAVTLIGRLVAFHAESDMEWARTVLRRFMWYLNDESGGMGWGVPEAMGEVLRHHLGLALEYGKILWSYVDPEGNHLENDALVEGALWGCARVTTVWKNVYSETSWKTIMPYINSPRAFTRLCAGIVGICFQNMGNDEVAESLRWLEKDRERVSFFWDGVFIEDSVGGIIKFSEQWIRW